MPKVTYFTATSLDGYIADENSSLDWLFETPHGDDETSWERLMAESAALVMGGTTYRSRGAESPRCRPAPRPRTHESGAHPGDPESTLAGPVLTGDTGS